MTRPVTIAVPDATPNGRVRQFATPRAAIRYLLTLVENDDLGRIKILDVPAESRRRTAGLPGPQGPVGSKTIAGKGEGGL